MNESSAPRIEINLAKIAHNTEILMKLYRSKGIEITGVTKGICGGLEIAEVFVNMGIKTIGDSKITNIIKMRKANINAEFMLLRIPGLSEIKSVVKYADISLNSELSVIQSLSKYANKYNKRHKVILMVEMGDLREGIMPKDLHSFIEKVMTLPNIDIIGIGVNFACFGGVKPTNNKMRLLAELSQEVEKKHHLSLTYVSGGNSANYNWFMESNNTMQVNNLRIGESLLLGRETLSRLPIPDLYTDAFTLVCEVIESKIKPSVPYGEIAQNSLGVTPQFQERGNIRRLILGIGFQDVLVSGLTPILDLEILGSSSDHTVLDAKNVNIQVGDEVTFSVNYGAMLSLMTSSNIHKKYLKMI
ncbi:alanine/ornithine racemase family PLP-dependent enzyme [Salipaludibacillus daqingensis]|uniref:alanine/ornithine racemase family PLP-dependent enzyme n=1 Tax=Salipaludibacillus daqingensis TaxID=3041001 RepID=UPI0024738957|nr:alanine/ornithine racemase family PLP-dependent enzyme [Salipaludibacillus daqingensis]